MFEIKVEEAVDLINQDGFDFIVEELATFGELMEKATYIKRGELSLDDLNNVNGGIIFTVAGIVTTVLGFAVVNVYCCCVRVWLASKPQKFKKHVTLSVVMCIHI